MEFALWGLQQNSLWQWNREFLCQNREIFGANREFGRRHQDIRDIREPPISGPRISRVPVAGGLSSSARLGLAAMLQCLGSPL
jgi:hypothetical protein